MKKILGLSLMGSFVLFAVAAQKLNQVFEKIFRDSENILRHDNPKDRNLGLCLNKIPANTRFFLYRRYSELAYDEDSKTQAAVASKFGVMAYLACRESTGRAVAMAAHRHEKDTRASHYGNSYWDLKTAFEEQIEMRRKTGNKSYFDVSTNGGIFQVSADRVDSIVGPGKFDLDLKVHKLLVQNVRTMGRMSDRELTLTCGISEMFPKEIDLVLWSLKRSVAAVNDIVNRDGKFQSISDLVWFHSIQTACPNLNLELAKLVHYLEGKNYFGPLNNTHNAETCGTQKSLCEPVFSHIGKSINI